MTKGQRLPKKTGPRTDFAWLVNEGVKAYQHQRRLPTLEMIQEEIASALAISARTLQPWRADRYPDRHEDLTRFASLCVRMAPELGQRWVIDLFRAANMSRYADQALVGIGMGRSELISGPRKNDLDGKLDACYIRPDAIFQQVKIDDFVGRDWLIAQVDAFLTDPSRKSGAFVLVGEVGVGKTAFLAHLVQQRNYIHLFGEQVRTAANVSRALRSLMAQLIMRYRLEPFAQEYLQPDSVPNDPIALERLLRLAASQLKPAERLVIVCDALDEVGMVPGGNVLGLPSVLPDGVYLIVSHELVPIHLNFQFVPHIVRLDLDSAENRRDMQAYLQRIAKRPQVTGWLEVQRCSASDFVQGLLTESGGSWLYLAHRVAEICAEQSKPCEPGRLPAGMAMLYAEHAAWWRETDAHRWEAVYAPLFATLAAAQEPITLDQWLQWANVNAPWSEVKRLLREAWCPFILQREDPQRGTVYTLYHHSLRDFAIGGFDRTGLSLAGQYVIDDLQEQIYAAHRRIVDYYRQRRGGSWSRLLGHDYADRHLAHHIEQLKVRRVK